MPRIIKNITKKQLVFVRRKLLGQRPYDYLDSERIVWALRELNRKDLSFTDTLLIFMDTMLVYDPNLYEVVNDMTIQSALEAACAAMHVNPTMPDVCTDVVGQLSLYKVTKVYLSYLANRIDLDLEQRKGSTHANQAQRQRAT